MKGMPIRHSLRGDVFTPDDYVLHLFRKGKQLLDLAASALRLKEPDNEDDNNVVGEDPVKRRVNGERIRRRMTTECKVS